MQQIRTFFIEKRDCKDIFLPQVKSLMTTKTTSSPTHKVFAVKVKVIKESTRNRMFQLEKVVKVEIDTKLFPHAESLKRQLGDNKKINKNLSRFCARRTDKTLVISTYSQLRKRSGGRHVLTITSVWKKL